MILMNSYIQCLLFQSHKSLWGAMLATRGQHWHLEAAISNCFSNRTSYPSRECGRECPVILCRRPCDATRVSSATAVVSLSEAQHGIRRTTGHRIPPGRFRKCYCGTELMEQPRAPGQAGGTRGAHDGWENKLKRQREKYSGPLWMTCLANSS